MTNTMLTSWILTTETETSWRPVKGHVERSLSSDKQLLALIDLKKIINRLVFSAIEKMTISE